MTNEIKLPPLPEPTKQLNFAEYFMGLALYGPEHMRDYATQAVTEALAQRDADHLAELRAYELTVANLREQLAQQAPQVPMTDAEIVAVVRAAAKNSAITRDGTTSVRIARAVEAHHGIKEKP